jgi:hypothetical protein
MRKYVQGGKAIEIKLLIFHALAQAIPPQVTFAMNRNQHFLILMTLRRKVDYYNLEKHLIMEWFLFCHILMIIK